MSTDIELWPSEQSDSIQATAGYSHISQGQRHALDPMWWDKGLSLTLFSDKLREDLTYDQDEIV